MTTPSDRTIAQLVNRASRLFAWIGDVRLSRHDFRYAQVPVLALLRDGRGLTQAELVKHTGVEQSSMAQLLARMEKGGAIERIADPDDARRRAIRLTPEAAKRLSAASRELGALDREAVRGLSAEEVKTLRSLLERVHANLERLVAEE
jgi:MarR family transcriptional regulator for hemolysin